MVGGCPRAIRSGQCSVVQVFAQPYMYWVGMDTDPRTTPEALAEFNRFYSTTHVHEVLAAHPGFVGVRRYELLDTDARGGEHRGPRWLAVYEAEDEAAALQYIKDNERPWLHRRKYSPWPPARRKAKTVWRMLWRRLPESDFISGDILQMVGTNDLPDKTSESHTHLELYRAFAHPEPGCPRYCAITDAAGPPAAEDAESVWQLVYRRLPPPD
jgi:hypothetical protein